MTIYKLHYRQAPGCVLRVILIAGLLAVAGLAAAASPQVLGENPEHRLLRPPIEPPSPPNRGTYRVKAVYMVPSNRSIQPGAERMLQSYIVRMQAWFREEMARLGYGPKSFIYETESSILIPRINLVRVEQPDTAFQGPYQERWNKILAAVAAAGFTLWNPRELVLIVSETQIQNPDGSFLYGTEDSTFFGGSAADFSGIGLVTGETLARFNETFLTDDQPYAGRIIPAIGPFPLVQSISFPAFEETTLSSTSSSAMGGALHELGHGLGLWHDFRNDTNFNGNLMGNGFRGSRGILFPKTYPNDDMRLSSGSALQLNYNRFFNNGKSFTDNTPPQVAIQAQNQAVVVNGQCGIEFSAVDTESSLAGALLIKDGHVVADEPLSGNPVTARLATYDYRPGEISEWLIEAFDTQGNRGRSTAVSLACPEGANRAPHPFVAVSKRQLRVREKVTLSAMSSLDPDGDASQMAVEWDLNGDGKFDTPPSSIKTFTKAYRKPGVYRIVARLTDEQGDAATSIPIGIRVGKVKTGTGINALKTKGR
jgi:hypothetical protein